MPGRRRLGVGDIKDARMSEAIATIVSAYELPRTPAGGHQLRARFKG